MGFERDIAKRFAMDWQIRWWGEHRRVAILVGDFLQRVGMPAINIHHSFLPAFPGADPYGRARARRQADRRNRPLCHRAALSAARGEGLPTAPARSPRSRR